MPKTASNDWKAHLAQDPTTLATCYRIEKRDGSFVTLSTCVFDLEIDDSEFDAFGFGLGSTSRTYSATALAPSESNESAGLRANNFNLQLPVDDDIVNELNLWSGEFDYAKIIVFTVNYQDISMGVFDPWRGYLGQVSLMRQTGSIEVNALATRAEQTIGRVTKENCRHRFGSPACGVNLAGNDPNGVAYTATGVAVTAQGTNAHLIFRCSALAGKPVDFYKRGRVLWTTGNNSGLEMDIATFDTSNGEFMLWDEMPNPIIIGDAGTFIAGCEKTHRACWEDHDNAINFGGYPKAPTLETAGQINRSNA